MTLKMLDIISVYKRQFLKKNQLSKLIPGGATPPKCSIHMVTLNALILSEYLRSTVTGN